VAESYYELLGVSTDASEEEIEQAYREKLKETHPDVSDEADASERTKRLIEAKEVLADGTERARYDRLGHEAFVEAEESPIGGDTAGDPSATGSAGTGRAGGSPGGGETRTGSSGASSAGSAGSGGTASATGSYGSSSNTAGTAASGTASAGRGGTANRQRVGGHGGHGGNDSWYDSTPGEGTDSGSDNWEVWDTDGSFAVNRDGDRYKHGQMFDSQRALILLSITFVVYPVLLFGALLPQFPLAVNLTVAVCVIMVIAFLQSVPEVGIAVFGIWTILLPVTMLWAGVEFASLRAFFAMLAVVFPFGLSLLTRVAIRPVSAG